MHLFSKRIYKVVLNTILTMLGEIINKGMIKMSNLVRWSDDVVQYLIFELLGMGKYCRQSHLVPLYLVVKKVHAGIVDSSVFCSFFLFHTIRLLTEKVVITCMWQIVYSVYR